MAFLHTHSCECIKSELELFNLPPTQTTIESAQWVSYKPFSSLSETSPIEFVVPGHGDEYIDLAHTMLSLRVEIKKIKKNEGLVEAAAATNKPGIVNNLLHSLFNQVDVFFNQKLVSPTNNAYAYRAYIETLLNYGTGAKSSHLTSVLWYKDTAGKMDDTDNGNEGLVKRRELLSVNNPIDLIGHLHCDVFNQDRFLLNGVEVRMRLVRSGDNFCFIDSKASTDFRIRIADATLLVRRVKISPGILLAHAKALSKTPAKYPLTRVEVKAMTIHSGVHGETLDNIILGQLPKRVILGFVNNKAYNGDYSLNPFNFNHYDINFLSLYVDGVQYPSKPLQPDFGKEKMFVNSYYTLFTGTGIHYSNQGNQITRNEYPDQRSQLEMFHLPSTSSDQIFLSFSRVDISLRVGNAASYCMVVRLPTSLGH